MKKIFFMLILAAGLHAANQSPVATGMGLSTVDSNGYVVLKTVLADNNGNTANGFNVSPYNTVVFAMNPTTKPAAVGLTISANASVCIFNKGTQPLDIVFSGSALSLSTTTCAQVPASQTMCWTTALETLSKADTVLNYWNDKAETVTNTGETRN